MEIIEVRDVIEGYVGYCKFDLWVFFNSLDILFGLLLSFRLTIKIIFCWGEIFG